MTIPARINLVTLGTRDFAAMRSFYERLGWQPAITTDGEFVLLQTGGAFLSLYGLDLLAEDANTTARVDASDDFRGFTLAINVETAEKVDEAIEAARQAGARIVKEPVQASWGGRSGYFADPEGNRWEVAWMPGSTFDERGGLILPADEEISG